MTCTPGEWKVKERVYGNTVTYDVYTIVQTKSGVGGYTRICQLTTTKEQRGNAFLIAAAPKLQKALENAYLILTGRQTAIEEKAHSLVECWAALREAEAGK